MSNVMRLPFECPDFKARVVRLWKRGYDTFRIATIINSSAGKGLVTEAEVANALAVWRDRKAGQP